jgi:hypothetical protein
VKLARRKRDELLGLLRPCFGRVESFVQARKYLAAVMSDLPERNGWSIAKFTGDKTPDKTQRLINRAFWHLEQEKQGYVLRVPKNYRSVRVPRHLEGCRSCGVFRGQGGDGRRVRVARGSAGGDRPVRVQGQRRAVPGPHAVPAAGAGLAADGRPELL